MSNAAHRPSVTALEELGRQFDGLEAREMAPRGQPRAHRTVLAIGTIAAVLAAFGIVRAVEPVAGHVARFVGTIENPAPARQAHPDTETHLEKPTPELVATCEERLQHAPTDELCQVIILVDRGELAPGDYTNEELHETLDRLLTPSGRLPDR